MNFNRFFPTLLLGTFFALYGIYSLITGTAYKAATKKQARLYGALYLLGGILIALIAVRFYY